VTRQRRSPRIGAASSYATSQTLLDRVKDQDQDAWTRLVYLYSPLVYHICKRYGVTGANADDVAQEVFPAVAAGISQHLSECNKDRSTFRSWLAGITKHKLADWHRQQERQPQAAGGSHAYARLKDSPEPEVPADCDDPSVTHSICHRALQLIRAEFEPQTWQAFWRTAVDGQSAVAIAAELTMSEAAVRKAKSRVLHRLKLEIGDLAK
jgi:RNA polymerase sigma-70 factor (ECF subfamily)